MMKQTVYNSNNDVKDIANKTETEAYFVDADQALFWYMEQKRKKFSIETRNYNAYSSEDSVIDKTKDLTVSELLKWSGVVRFPKSKEESAMVVAVLDKAFAKLKHKTQVIVKLNYLGDFATEDLYTKAKSSQKILKERGYRIIMFYKYPKTKVGKMLGVDRKTVTRHVQKAYDVFDSELGKRGFIAGKDM
ncbi:MAG: hypothetical protein GY793_06285 [Proteobacteria bacterium]|nr:hypothetical protein [Pseudomonadota bacterium]